MIKFIQRKCEYMKRFFAFLKNIFKERREQKERESQELINKIIKKIKEEL